MYDTRVPISAFAIAMSEHAKKMERERDMARATANTFRQCAEVTFGVMPFPRKFHWENDERMHGARKEGD